MANGNMANGIWGCNRSVDDATGQMFVGVTLSIDI